MKGKKIVVLIVAVFILGAGGVLGVMAAAGILQSDKVKVLELLAQVPDRLSWVSTGEYVGIWDMGKNMEEKGSTGEVTLKDVKIKGKDLGEISEIFDGLAMTVSSQSDASGRCRMGLKAEKNNTPASINYFSDTSELGTFYLSAPEIISDKVFKVSAGVNPVLSNMNITQSQKFYADAVEFLKEEADKIKKDISCEKMKDSGYQIVIPKESLGRALDDIVPFIEGETGIVNYFNSIGQITESKFDFIARLRGEIEKIKADVNDIALQIYEKNGDIASIKLAGLDGEDKFEFVELNFEGQKGDSTATLKVGDKKQAVSLILRDEKKEKYTSSITLELSGTVKGKISVAETINPSDNAYELKLEIDVDDGAKTGIFPIGCLTAKGSIKDLKQGSHADYVLDDVTISSGGEELLKMSLDVNVGVQEGEVKPLEGEEVEIRDADSDVVKTYLQKALMSWMQIGAKWGLLSKADLSNSLMELGDSDFSGSQGYDSDSDLESMLAA